MAKVSARTKGPVGLLFAAIVAVFPLGVMALNVTTGSHRFPLRAVGFEASSAHPPVTAGIAAVLDPSVALAVSRHTPTSLTNTAAASPTTVERAASTPEVHPTPALTAEARPTPITAVAASRTGWGCAAAFAWLASHSAPGYRFVCPGYAEGHQAMTCDNNAACPGEQVIVIANPCPAAYMNEAHNSWIISGLTHGVIDPFGYC